MIFSFYIKLVSFSFIVNGSEKITCDYCHSIEGVRKFTWLGFFRPKPYKKYFPMVKWNLMMAQEIQGPNVLMEHKKIKLKVMVEMDNVKLFMLSTGLVPRVTRYFQVNAAISMTHGPWCISHWSRPMLHAACSIIKLSQGWFEKNLDAWNWSFISNRKSLFTWSDLEKLSGRRLLWILSRLESSFIDEIPVFNSLETLTKNFPRIS